MVTHAENVQEAVLCRSDWVSHCSPRHRFFYKRSTLVFFFCLRIKDWCKCLPLDAFHQCQLCFMIQFPSELALTQNTLRATENESPQKGCPVRRLASSSQSIHSWEHVSVVCTSPSLTGEAARKKKHQARAWPHSCHLLTVKVKETH